MNKARIGLIGLGYVGRYVYDQVSSRPELGLEVVFVHDLAPERLAGLPAGVALKDIRDFGSRRPDLVVEMAHPGVTREYGGMFLQAADYMPLSMTAFADAALERRLLDTARASGRCLFIPHGAVVGLENIFEGREVWEEVTMVMKKSPRNLDFSAAPQFKAAEITRPTVLYDGPTRAVCPQFPRNVNSHATVALAGIGFDRTRSVLIADPGLDVSVIEISARGKGVAMKIERSNPLKGVSGVFTLNSTLAAVCRAKGAGGAMQIC
ncbi:MAG TPA: aspartate dehydrogenase domain-containing protein [Candidatus Acidoferrum sp.]|nr:aspartate dehydrogenase domain-containing protein [Candidatus Acidoferrum sp.]